MNKKNEIEWPIDFLPKTVVYSIDEDYYSQFYDANKSCTCGCNSWYSSMLSINNCDNDVPLALRRVHKCVECKKVRVSSLKPIFRKVIKESSEILKSFLKIAESHQECLYILKNTLANLQNLINSEEMQNQNKLKKMLKDSVTTDTELESLLYEETNKKNTFENVGLN